MKPVKSRLRLWVKDLQTTKERQGSHFLKDRPKRGAQAEYCCLGRACEVYHKATGKGEWSSDNYFTVDGIGSAYLMPDAVAEWYGIRDNPRLGSYSASYWNDTKMATFSEIAFLIKKEYSL